MLRAPSTMSLLCFEASARLKTFTAAALELCLTQGAVSRQVIALEDKIGTPLFVRSRAALSLTDAGSSYLAEVAPLLQRLELATANAMALKGRGGALALSVGASFGSYWLIPRLPAFTRDHAEITLSMATRIGPVDFNTMRVDASLEFGEGRRPGLRNEFVLPLVMSPYAAPEWIARNGRSLAKIPPAALTPLLIHHSTVPEGWFDWFGLAGIPEAPGPGGPRYQLMSMAFNAAVAGLGVVLLPDFMVGDAVASGRLASLSRRRWQSARGYYLVYPDALADARPLQVFRHWLARQTASPVAPN